MMTHVKQRNFARVALTLLCLCLMGSFAQAQTLGSLGEAFDQQKGSLKVEKGMSLEQVLERMEDRFNVVFLYRTDVVAGKKVSRTMLLPNNVKKVLQNILKEHRLLFKNMNPKTYGIYSEKQRAKPVAIQQEDISGTVTDAGSGETLPGVNILVKGTSTGASTDADGHYELTVESLQDTLVVSFVGYQTREVPINGRTTIDISMQPQAITGEEMVVVGYGTQREKDLSSSVSKIEGEDLVTRTVSSTTQALQGLSPGVTIKDKGGGPGDSDVVIRVRGITTLSGNDPLILVDGIEQSLNDINTNNIESISVLKDAASTAIYGSRAANGVVLITTKRGTSDELTINLNSYYAIQKAIYNPEQIGMEGYMRMQNDAYVNAGLDVQFTEDEIDTWINSDNRIKYPLVNDWIDVMFSPAPQQSHDLSVSGGNEKLRTLLSVNYLDQGGIISNTHANRRRIRLNTDYEVSEGITISGDFNYRLKNYKQPTYEANAFKYMWASSNFAVPRYPDGTYGLSSDGISPLVQAELRGVSNFKRTFGMINLKADIDLLKGLNLKSQYGFTSNNFNEEIYSNAYTINDYNDKSKILQQENVNSLTESRNNDQQFKLNNLLTYEIMLGNHSFDALLGYSQISYKSDYLSASRKNFYSNNIKAISQGSLDSRDNDGYETDWGLRSYFSRLNYNYDEKYFLEVNSRYDGSSRFTGSNKYGFFPSFSAAWRISEESFWSDNISVINEFKIRGSWGQTGNQSVGLYSYLETLSARNYNFGGNAVQGLYQSAFANKDLSWETTTQENIGIDASLWEDRFSLTFDYYRKMTRGILLSLPVPLIVGLNAPPQNAGKVENKGWELALSYTGVLNDFNYNFAFNVSDVHNKITNLEGTGPYINNQYWVTTIRKEGLPIDSFLGYKTDGFFQSADEIENYPTYAPNTKPGDIKYIDNNNDGLINSSDMVPIGSDIPHYAFGLNMDFNYKNFDMNLQLQGVGKVDAMIGEWAGNVSWQSFVMDFQKDYWTPENTDAKYPRPTAFADKNWLNSDFWTVNAAYLKLKNLQIGYTLPSDITEQFNIQKLRIYASGSNLFTISKVNKWGFDPEFDFSLRRYPQLAVYTFGINLRF